MRDAARAAYVRDGEKVRRAAQVYAAQHKAEKKKSQRRWHQAHRVDQVAKAVQWRLAHLERARMLRKLSTAKWRVEVGHVTAGVWDDIQAFYEHACAQCRTPATVRRLSIDHYAPLSKGGTHAWHNVWPLCLPCNRKKHATILGGVPPHVTFFLLACARPSARSA